VGLGSEVGDGDRGAVVVALQAGAFVVLELEELQQAHVLVGGGHQAQLAVAVREQYARRAGAEQPDAAVGEQAEEVDQIEVGDQTVREFDERLGQEAFIYGVHLP
jgi:hypothetical protein